MRIAGLLALIVGCGSARPEVRSSWTVRDHEALCGKASTPSGDGCAPKSCAVIDQETGVCLPPGSLRSIAEAMEIPILPDETLGCPEGARLIAGGNRAVCVPVESTCGPGAHWEKKGVCVPDGPLPSFEKDGVIDVAGWVRAHVGPDGGYGSSYLCGEFARAPWMFTAATDLKFVLAIGIELRFRNNDVEDAQVRVEAADATTGQPLASEIIEQRVDRLISGLRGLHGNARASAVSTRIRCILPIGPRPMATPLAH